jgi:hypothetical protein
MFTPTNPENAADVEAIKGLLTCSPIGQTVSYAAISAAIGRDILAHRWLLQKARTEAESETGGIYETVRNEGLQRITSDKIPDVGLHSIRQIRRAAKRGYRRLDSVRVNDLSPELSSRLIAHKSQLGAVSLVADGRRSVSITKEVTQTGATVPAGRVLDLLKDR